jgi:hypothetical protein
MSTRVMAFTVAAFLTVAAAACDSLARPTAPELPRYESQQAPANATDSSFTSETTTASDTTIGRGGGGYLGSGY